VDLPFGAHGTPVDPEADLSPPGCGALIMDVIEALGLDDVTLVGNDSGGAYSQIGVAAHPERIARLVLASCETPEDVFPPPPFTGLRAAAQSVEFLKSALQGLRSPERRLRPEAFGLLAKHRIEDAVFDAYCLPVIEDDRILHDIAKAMRSASETHVKHAGESLVARFRIPSIVVTLATMMAIRDALRWTTEGAWVQNLPASFQWAGLGQSAGWWLIVASSLVIFLVFAWALRNLAAGRAVYATGCAPEAARLAGLSPRAIVFCVFVVSGILTGIAALLSSIRFIDIQSNTGVGLEMKVIAAVVVGGASISGGRGTLAGTLLGVALLGVIGTALTFLGVNPYWEKAAQGAIILVGVISDAWARTEKHGVIAAAVQ
jgi:branched-subunit amino acid ABC-type transport system permease component